LTNKGQSICKFIKFINSFYSSFPLLSSAPHTTKKPFHTHSSPKQVTEVFITGKNGQVIGKIGHGKIAKESMDFVRGKNNQGKMAKE
jgi:hypothetical protein